MSAPSTCTASCHRQRQALEQKLELLEQELGAKTMAILQQRQEIDALKRALQEREQRSAGATPSGASDAALTWFRGQEGGAVVRRTKGQRDQEGGGVLRPLRSVGMEREVISCKSLQASASFKVGKG